jgi:hypothetical protein
VTSAQSQMCERRVRIERGRGDGWHSGQEVELAAVASRGKRGLCGWSCPMLASEVEQIANPAAIGSDGGAVQWCKPERSVEAMALRWRHTNVSREEIQPIHALHVASVVVTTGQQDCRLAEDFGAWRQGTHPAAPHNHVPHAGDAFPVTSRRQSLK